jgi:chromate transport protein ChrA
MGSIKTSQKPTFGEALSVWAKIGVLSFGGPAGQIALMHRVLVDERRFIAEDRFLHALNFCMLLPGPEAMQFAAIFFLDAPFPLIIAGAALIGLLFALASPAPTHEPATESPPVPLSQTLQTAALWLTIWILPLLLVAALFGRAHVTTDIALLFSKLAVVTFGGAYSVLAYMAQQAVETYGWLSPGEMLDGLGLAETTPGPSSS